jgi:hypothetical protein
MPKKAKKWKYTSARKFMGDDMYSWAIFDKKRPNEPILSGLSHYEVTYERQSVENYLIKKYEGEKKHA